MKTVKGSKYQALICGVELYEIIPETGYNFVTSNTKDNDGPAPSNGDNGGKCDSLKTILPAICMYADVILQKFSVYYSSMLTLQCQVRMIVR